MIIQMSGQNKEQIIAARKKLVNSGLVLATWGNISCRVPRSSYFLITPSGMPYDQLKPEDLVLVGRNGQVVEGMRKPSKEVLMHLAIYTARADVQAVVHTHSPFASSFAVAREPIPVILEEMAQLIGGPVKVANYGLPGTEELAKFTVEALEQRNAVLLANHGVVAAGTSVNEALTIAFLVEKCAQVMLGAKALGVPYTMGSRETQRLRESFLKHYGQK
ncbi:MAG: class II aldolase/adducin family protein [Desulfitobacteriaceae bacterium]|nr:class II aldolase/adducin family protein [Desulfitobacteriaceae bacterium]